jgi:hypothetical protein
MQIAVLGIDLGKNLCSVAGLDPAGCNRGKFPGAAGGSSWNGGLPDEVW